EGNNLYVFGKGDGQDVINRYNDTTANKLNTLRFKEGVLPSEIVLRQVRNVSTNQYGIEVSIVGTTDKVTIDAFFANNSPSDPYNPIQKIEFFGNTAGGLAEIRRRVFEGASGADTLIGTAAAEQIFGQDGNDSLTAGAGDDTVH